MCLCACEAVSVCVSVSSSCEAGRTGGGWRWIRKEETLANKPDDLKCGLNMSFPSVSN